MPWIASATIRAIADAVEQHGVRAAIGAGSLSVNSGHHQAIHTVSAPDYPLWTGAVSLCGGRAVHYRCDEANGWDPDLADIEALVADAPADPK